ncbi:MAG: DNA alkylation repair protein [Prevotella sp.]|nr:DNA alkylation repair protein [Prevotella sp.]
MKQETHDKLRQIKQSFRSCMNGVTAQSMREKGTNYKINWGVSLLDLNRMASEYGKDAELAMELWKENIRECKILATLIMPAEDMYLDLATLWMEQMPTVEMAELAAFNLFQYIEDAPLLAYRWIASEKELEQVCGYMILARLFMRKEEPDDRGINEFLDQALAALQSNMPSVSRAATTAIRRFSELGEEYEKIVTGALKASGFSLF